jgi:hypothetical protein
MTAPPLDDFMLRLAPQPPLPIDQTLARARGSIRSALADLAAVDDSAMEKPWPWRGEEADVRYGFYRQYEALEDLRARIAPTLAGAVRTQSPARPLTGAATAARWDLHGLLAGLAEADLDREPGGGEWTLRQTLAHIIGGQRAYGWYTMWWLSQRKARSDELPVRVPQQVIEANPLPDEDTEAIGSLDAIRARLDDILDLSAGVFAQLRDDDMSVPARWSGIAVDVRFRVVRWASHMREHTVQLEKTLVTIDRPPSEAARLTRLVAAAWGRLEADVYLWSPGTAGVSEPLARAKDVAAGIAADAASVRLSAA